MVEYKVQKQKIICGTPITIWEAELDLNKKKKTASKNENIDEEVFFSDEELSELKKLLGNMGVKIA